MHIRNSVYYIIVVLLILVSCTNRDARYLAELADVDSIAEVDAFKAKHQLQDLKETMTDASENVQAYYNLLCVKADNKANVKLTTDSIILPSVRYYEQHNEEGRLPEAYFLLGRAYSDMRESEKAMFYFHKTLQCDSTQVSDYLKSRTYAQMGYIYLRNRLCDEARNSLEVAYFYCKAIGDTTSMRYCKEDIAAIDSFPDSLKIDDAERTKLLLKLQQINEKVKNGKLLQLNSDLQSEVRKDKSLMTMVICGCLLMAFIAIAVVYYLRMNRSKRKDEMIEWHEETHVKAEPQEPVRRQFYDKEIYELISNHIASSKVLKPSDWTLIEERLLSSFPAFKDNLYSVYNFSETEYHVCLLTKLEVSPSNIAKLLALSNSSVSQIRLRLQRKVFGNEGTAKDWDNYVLSL